MPDVVGVRFKSCGKIYSFAVNGASIKPGMWVVVDSELGLTLGMVVKARHTLEKPDQKLKKVLRIATIQDLEADRNNRLLEEDAMGYCVESAQRHNLIMKVVKTEATLDRKRLIFYFTAEGRVDFRELVRDLASKYRTRIEMRQIGVRDEVKYVGGIGCCGREVCCKSFLTSFEPISIRMAKKQELTLNPGKLSGICGRLMCCLSYEIEAGAQGKKPKGKAKRQEARVEPQEKGETPPPVPAPPRPERVPVSETQSQPEPQKPVQPEHPKPPAEAKPDEKTDKDSKTKRKGKGKPFNKRRKFWKKKKR